MTIFVSIDLENPRFNVYKLSYWLWERLNGKKGTFVRRLPLDPPSPPCVVPHLQKFLTHPLLVYGVSNIWDGPQHQQKSTFVLKISGTYRLSTTTF